MKEGYWKTRGGEIVRLELEDGELHPSFPYIIQAWNYRYGEYGGWAYEKGESGDRDLMTYCGAFKITIEDHESGGTKYDSDKPRTDLLVPEALELTAEVFGFGSNKYQKVNIEELRRWLLQLNVHIQIERNTVGGYVALVTKDISKLITPNTKLKWPHISVNIEERTRTDWTDTIEVDGRKEKSALIIKQLEEMRDWSKSTELQRNSIIQYYVNKVTSVLYANKTEASSTSTTVMRMEELGEYYVLGATTASDFLTTLSQVLREQFGISETLNNFHTTGDYNWQQGISNSRLIGALLRHVFAYMRGESEDPESGISHLGHASCCIQMLIWNSKNRPDLDDRANNRKEEQ